MDPRARIQGLVLSSAPELDLRSPSLIAMFAEVIEINEGISCMRKLSSSQNMIAVEQTQQSE